MPRHLTAIVAAAQQRKNALDGYLTDPNDRSGIRRIGKIGSQSDKSGLHRTNQTDPSEFHLIHMIHDNDRRDALLRLRVRRRNFNPEPAAEVAVFKSRRMVFGVFGR